MTTASHTLSIDSVAIPLVLGRPTLEPVRLSGREGLNSLFEYELLLKTPDDLKLGASGAADFDLDDFIGREICCSIELDGAGEFIPGAVGDSVDRVGAGTRQINAVIAAAAFWGEEGRHLQYKLTLRPWLHLLDQSTDCKIFQNKTVVDILDELLGAYPFPVDKRLFDTYPQRDYQSQHNESDFAFFSRLCQEWGISYHFEHSEGKHRLVLSDAMAAYRENASEAYRQVEYHAPGWKIDAEYLHSFVPEHQLTSGRYTTRDYDYTRPRADLTQSRSDPRPTGQADGEVYQWHAGRGGSHYAQPRAGTAEANDPQDEGRQLALLRMQALRTHGARARASGNLRGMVPGCTFRLAKHPRQTANAEYLILDTTFLIEDVGQDSQIKEAAPGRKQQWKVEVDFTAHPVTETLRPALTQPKPYVRGPQAALVVGPEGQNIWTDQYGRIKVQFSWDRLGQKNQHSSCWVRVSSEWAGNQLGGIHIPRIGQEVIVSYFDGDPDLPVVTGRLYNQNNLPPWALPGQSALSGLRSRELVQDGGNSAAGRSSHMALDDTPGEIQAQLQCDHLSTSVSLGYITRIEGNAGRKDPRGEGIEARTDGHVVIRGEAGALFSTEARPNAQGHAKDMGETVARLAAGRAQHQALSDSAQQAGAHEAGDQDEVTRALKAQNDAIQGGNSTGKGHFPELAEPHMVFASPAGIESTTAGSTHIASEEHNALTSRGHTSISAGKSLLVSVMKAIRMYAYETGIRLAAAAGNLDFAALKNSMNFFAMLDIRMDGDNILIQARKTLTLAGGASSIVLDGDIIGRTPGRWIEHAATHGSPGPKSLDQAHPVPPAAQLTQEQAQRLIEEQFVLFEHAGGLRLPEQKYRVAFEGGRTVEGRTNERGETQVVQSMVAQIAKIEVLRNAEEGVLASYAPLVRTPARETCASASPGAEKNERFVAGKAFKPNADEATSQEKAPVHTSCDPNNWGLRMHSPKKSEPGLWDYPIARAYVDGIKPVLMAVPWRNVTWPLSDALKLRFNELFRMHILNALGQGAFGLPQDAMPLIEIVDETNAADLSINIRNPKLQGFMRPRDWLLAVCQADFSSIIDAARRGADVSAAVCELASTLYHEARHAQQFFWTAALLQQHPGDYAHLPQIQRVWRGQISAERFEIAARTPLPDEPSARAGLHRMLIGIYYWWLAQFDASNKKRPPGRSGEGYLADVLPTELQLARKAAHALLQNVGLGGLSIDVDDMARSQGGDAGYRMRPWEEDSFVCDHLVKRLWVGGTYAALPEPGFCTNMLRSIAAGRNAGGAGESTHAR